MARLIDAEKLLQRLTTVVSTVKEGILYYNSVYNIVNEQPTVDIMEVIERENRKYNKESQSKSITNYDRIKSMTVEEMAEFFDNIVNCHCYTICKNFNKCTRNNATEPICKNYYKKWLESECEEE